MLYGGPSHDRRSDPIVRSLAAVPTVFSDGSSYGRRSVVVDLMFG